MRKIATINTMCWHLQYWMLILRSVYKHFLWKVRALVCKTNGLWHAADALDPPDPPDPVSSVAARDPSATLAGGQDDSSYTKLPQINSLQIITLVLCVKTFLTIHQNFDI